MKCYFCSSPLPKSGLICNYCNKLNHLNKRLMGESSPSLTSEFKCPICDINLDVTEIEEKVSFHYCTKCDGLLTEEDSFDKIIAYQINKSNHKDSKKLHFIQNNPRDNRKKSSYHPCPICKKIMQRINYKKQSGIILDACEEHGIWIDGGELRQINDWYEAGGNSQNLTLPFDFTL